MSSHFWKNKRVIVSGGAGFLGTFLIQNLFQRGAVDRLLEESLLPPDRRPAHLNLPGFHSSPLPSFKPSDLIIIHLAARVGGIDANRAHPAEFFYDNLMMGVQFMHQAWRIGAGKFVALWTVCAYPKFTPLPFKEEDLWNGYPEETNAPYGLAKEIARLSGFSGQLVFDTSKPNRQPRCCLDMSRAEQYFGFWAHTPFEEGLRQTIAWYQANRK